MNKVKPYSISKHVVFEAYKRVKANRGAAGIDGQTIEDFEKNLKNNLFKIWNRMSSGSYMPSAVKVVEIPKSDGKVRKLGIPTVPDRIAQMVVKMHLEPIVEPQFHESSYGYRPGKSAHQAVEKAKVRCWIKDWVIDLDIKGFFDNLDHELVMRAVKKHTSEKWILLYVERWLKASAVLPDGTLVTRDKGTPQGGVISPLLANIFMHHVFDDWLNKHIPKLWFERYADDIIIHCGSQKQVKYVLDRITARLKQCKLELHPDKTKVVYCKDQDRKEDFKEKQFDFLGFTFRAREVVSRKGEHFIGFNPAISQKAGKHIRGEIRKWRLHLWTNKSIQDVARMTAAQTAGWINYYGKFRSSDMKRTLQSIDRYLIKWVQRKYKRFRGHQRRASHYVDDIARRDPSLFPHWVITKSWVFTYGGITRAV